MAAETGIAWTGATWNPVIGCSKVSPGCTNCYAETVAGKLEHKIKLPSYAGLTSIGGHLKGKARAHWTGRVKCLPEKLAEPLHWRKPRRIFVNSMSDLFHEDVPFEFIAAVFGVVAACPQHEFQILTKRPERMRKWFRWLEKESGPPWAKPYFSAAQETTRYLCDAANRLNPNPPDPPIMFDRFPWPLANVWPGFSAENQSCFDGRWVSAKDVPAAVTMVSLEPLLEEIVLPPDFLALGRRAWVIVGGESGPGHRPMQVEWAQSIADQCQAAGVPVFVKQDSGPVPGRQGRLPAELWALKQFPEVEV